MDTQGADMVIQPGLATMASSETLKTGDSTLDELSKKLGGLVLKVADSKKVDEPSVFSGEWTESSALWVERYEKYTNFAKKEQTDQDKVDFAKLYLGGDALEWHSGASLLYREWESFKKAFTKKFDERKSKSEARKHIASIDIYKGKIIVNYGKLKRLFEIAGISDEEEQYDLLLEKLNHKDYDKMYDLTDKTATGIMEYLLAEEEKWSSRKETKSSVKPITASKLAFPRAAPKRKKQPTVTVAYVTSIQNFSNDTSTKTDLQSENAISISGHLKINNKSVRFGYDLGAAVSVISRELAENLGIKIEQDKYSFIQTANSERIKVSKCLKVSLDFDTFSTEMDLNVIDSPDKKLFLLGLDWIYTLGAEIILKKGMIELNLGGKTHKIKIEVVKSTKINRDKNEIIYNVYKITEAQDFINSELTKNKIEQVEKLTEDNKDVFAEEISELGSSDIPPYDINLTDTTPIRVKPYELADSLKKEVQT
ncbi:hypothetical protein AYI70_g6071 [Smittium culicis]|uniref:Retrotransposon gag domain-containing protein n=1 Tax=Smittium culicis TaxID=133412 RepID=A0A1R1XRX7_9FUNG|nr:hypothetical protein AYI70_g6071 [Smittium culicis]